MESLVIVCTSKRNRNDERDRFGKIYFLKGRRGEGARGRRGEKVTRRRGEGEKRRRGEKASGKVI